MRLPVALRLATRELRGGLSGFRVFLLCLALGVAAIAAVGSVRSAIETGLTREGATILGGDAELTFTYRLANEDELAWMQDNAQRVSRVIEFRSMAVVGQGDTSERALVQVRAVDDAFPLLGRVQMDPVLDMDAALAPVDGVAGALVSPLMADRLGLKVGDRFKLGRAEFRINALLLRAPDSATGGFTIGPPVLVRADALEGSGLIAPGSLYETHYRLTLPADTDIVAVKQQAQTHYAERGVRWRDRRNGAPGVRAFVDRIGSFLVLVGLAGLAVGGVGVAAAVRAYLGAKTATIATLRTLGASRATIFLTYFAQIGVLTLIGVGAGLVVGGLLPVALAPVIAAQLPVPIDIGLYPAPLAEAALYGILTALVFTLWPLARTEQVRPAALYRGAIGAFALPRWRYVIVTLALVAALVGVAAGLSGVAWLAYWTAGGIAWALVILAIAALLLRGLSRRLARSRAVRGRPALRLALGAIGGPGSEAVAVVLSLGLGLSVLATVGQIDANLRNAIARDLPDVAPSFFFVDIQPDQLPGFLERTRNDPAVSRVDTAPMLRGVLTRINGRPAAEVAGDHWVIQGDRGITYAAGLPERTTLTAGTWWDKDYSGPPLISFAAEEAAEMGLQLGDELTINILGRDITGTIASFRDVNFSTAGIGFVISMNPAALAGAPHTSIATVYADEDAEAKLLRDLAGSYPNITAIRVKDAIDRVSSVLAGLAAATSLGAGATLLTGFVVLIGAAAAGEPARVFEAAVLKTLGASRRRILTSFALRSALMGAGAGLVAIFAGSLGGWAVMTFVMDSDYALEPMSAIAIVVGGALITLIAGLAFALRPMSVRPARVLRSQE